MNTSHHKTDIKNKKNPSKSKHFAHCLVQHLDFHGTYNVQNELEQYGDVGDGDEAVQQHQAVDEGAAAAGEVPAEAGQLRLLTQTTASNEGSR